MRWFMSEVDGHCGGCCMSPSCHTTLTKIPAARRLSDTQKATILEEDSHGICPLEIGILVGRHRKTIEIFALEPFQENPLRP